MAARVTWWKIGDHPADKSEEIEVEDGANYLSDGEVVRRYKPRGKNALDLCTECSQAWEVHGVLVSDARTIVHPGDDIVTHDDGTYTVERPDPMGAALAAAEAAAAEESEADDPQG